MQTWLVGFLFILVSVALAHIGILWVRRAVPLSVLESHQDVAGFIIGVLGALYAVLLAFVVVVVWGQFEEARTAVSNEANQLGDLARMAQGFAPPVEQNIQAAIRSYAEFSIQQEWPAMQRGDSEGSQYQSALENLWKTYGAIEPQTPREISLYDQSLERLNDLSDSRRTRLHISHEGVPLIMWMLLLGGAVTTIGFTYFFAVKNFRAQALMTAALTSIVAFILFLILALDNPFKGAVSVSPEPFQRVLARMQPAR